jgi:hypothetical protein
VPRDADRQADAAEDPLPVLGLAARALVPAVPPAADGRAGAIPDERMGEEAMSTIRQMTAFASGHLAVAAVVAAAVLAAGFMAWRAAVAARRALAGKQAEDVLTVVAAAMATAVAANGMWRFFGTVLHFSGAERAAMFAFLELAVVTCAFRARRNMRAFGSAGAEGIAVWVLSGLSAVFSALDARSGAEAVFRLAPPLVAAWLWHRAMSLEHRKLSGRSVHWRLTAERVLVWLGLAEPSARAASDVDAHRRIARLARAAKRLRELRAAGAASWRQDRARRRLDKAMEAAVEHADLAADAARQDQMRDQIGALNAAEALAGLAAEAPWDRRAAEADQVAAIRQEAEALVQAAGQARDQAVSEVRAEADQARAEAEDAGRAAAAAAREREEIAAREQAAGQRLAEAAAELGQLRTAHAAALAQAADAHRDGADRLAGAVTDQVRALEQSQSDLRARVEAAERELDAARRQAADLGDALARAGSGADGRADGPAPEIDRDALVAELAAGIRAAAADGDKWRPDYDALIERTGRKLRWCEYLVQDARSAVFGTAGQDAGGHAECNPGPAPWPADAGPGAGPDADPGVPAPDDAGELALAGAH